MNIRAVIWDFGGVLLRTEDYSGREQLANNLGRSRAELEDLVFNGVSGERVQLGLISDQEHWNNVRLGLGLSLSELLVFQKAFWSGDRLDYQLIEFIRALRPRYKTGLLSNNFPSLRQTMREVWRIEDAFDTIIVSAEVGLLKPDKRIYRLALDELQVAPEESIFVDDFELNLSGAHAVGMESIHFQSSAQVQAELLQLLDSQAYSGE